MRWTWPILASVLSMSCGSARFEVVVEADVTVEAEIVEADGIHSEATDDEADPVRAVDAEDDVHEDETAVRRTHDDADWKVEKTLLIAPFYARLGTVSCIRQFAMVRNEVSRAIASSIALGEHERVACLSEAGRMVATMHYASVGADFATVGEGSPIDGNATCPVKPLIERVNACVNPRGTSTMATTVNFHR
jgi:hypothetical protein